MADQNRVYDQENPDQNQDRLKPKEDLAPEHERQIAQPGLAEKLRQSHDEYKDFQKKQKADDEAAAKRNEDTRGYWRELKDEYDPDMGALRRMFSKRRGLGLFSRRRVLGMSILGVLLVVIFSFSSLFSVFKMDHIMSNIDEKAFVRLSGTLDSRNTVYMRTYMQLRLADVCSGVNDTCPKLDDLDKDNLIFRADEVRRSKNPVFNWYRTMRSSNFEAEVFNKNGIFITSGVYRDANGVLRPRTVKFTIKSETISLPGNIQSLINDSIKPGNNVDWVKLNSLYQNGALDDFFDKQILTSNSDRRGVINKIVNDRTHWWNVFKRRQLRRDIANKTGVPKWRFFDDARTKAETKKIQVRNRVIDSITPKNTKSGKFIDCLFGITDCRFSGDPGDTANNTTDSDRLKDGEKIANPKDPQNPKTTYDIDYSKSSAAVKKAAGLVGGVVSIGNWASLINNLHDVDKAIRSGAIQAQVAIARGVQAMALYQTFETVRDQMKTGEANSEQINQFMQNIANFTAAEAWVKMVEGKGSPQTTALAAGTAKAVNYCSANHQPTESEFAYLCNDTIIGSTATGAQALQDAYNKGPGVVLSPILDGYDKGFGWFGDAFNKIFNATVGTAVSAIISNIPGLAQTMQDAVGWATGKLAVMLGAAKMYSYEDSSGSPKGLVPSGQLGNGVTQGAVFTAESAMRGAGAMLTTPASKVQAGKVTAAYQQEKASQQSFMSRYLSPSNQNSLASQALFAASQIKLSSFGHIFINLKSVFGSIASAINLPFNHKAAAVSGSSGYVGAEVAQIDTYDFPSQCYSLSPMNMSPTDGLTTNIKQIFPGQVKDRFLTWETMTNSQSWYGYVYSLKGADDPVKYEGHSIAKAQLVYNCALLDNAVRGGLGYLYGYTKDNGYDEIVSGTAATDPGTTSIAGTSIDIANLYKDSVEVACAPGTRSLAGAQEGYTNGEEVDIRVCAIPNLPSSGGESTPGNAYYIKGADGDTIVNSRVSGAVLAITKAAANAGINLRASSSFRTMVHQQALCPCDSETVARPGYSNHQMGLAIDFAGLPGTPGPVSGNAIWDWLSTNAGNFGYKNLPREAWHWSPNGK